MSELAPKKDSKNNALSKTETHNVAPLKQGILDLGIEIQRDVNGIEMGILDNGIPFLTESGLANIAGVSRKVIFDIRNEWEEHHDNQVLGKDRISFIKKYLFERGYQERKLYIETKKDGSVNYAYPDLVCMAILEYYTFEAKSENETAKINYRRLATYGLQRFIYDSLNYRPPLEKWKYHNDRVSILKNSAPSGHFIVFHEITGLIVDLINANLTVSDKTIPDISVGIAWAEYWKENKLEEKYGPRIPCDHSYPDYYPQASSNPQEIHAYPDASLPTFRQWFRSEYLPTKFPAYILRKQNLLPGGVQEAAQIAQMYSPKQIEGK